MSAGLELAPGCEDKRSGPRCIRFNLAGSGEWGESASPTLKAQLKTTLPIPFAQLEGVELPLSVTVANRTDLVDETEVRGLIGFTIDTVGLARALTGG